MKNTSTTLEIPEGSKATIQGKVIDGKNYLVVEVEREPEFLEYMNEIYVDRDFYSRGKIIEMAKDKYVELHGNVNNKKELKDTIVSRIKQRIESEYRKHPDLDWAEIAARKIYAEIENKKQ